MVRVAAAAAVLVLAAAAAAGGHAAEPPTDDGAVRVAAGLTKCVSGCGSKVTSCLLGCYGGGGARRRRDGDAVLRHRLHQRRLVLRHRLLHLALIKY